MTPQFVAEDAAVSAAAGYATAAPTSGRVPRCILSLRSLPGESVHLAVVKATRRVVVTTTLACVAGALPTREGHIAASMQQAIVSVGS